MSGQSNILLSYGPSSPPNQEPNGLLAGLFAYYKMDDTSGTLVNALGDPALNSQAQSIYAYNQSGKINGAHQFVRASSNYARFPVISGIGTDDLSVSLWVYITAVPPTSGAGCILTFSETDGVTDFTCMNIRVTDSGAIGVSASRFPNHALVQSSPVTLNTWHHIVATSCPSTKTVSLYIDNNYIGSSTWTGSTSANQQYTIGRYNAYYGHHLSGYVDEVAIYKGIILDPTNVHDLNNDGSGLALDLYNYSGKGLLTQISSYWPLNDATATQVDIFGIYDGTITGATHSAPGKIDTAVSFDGSGDFISLGNIPTPSAFTISAWFKCSNVADARTIICKRDLSGTGSGDNWGIRLLSGSGYLSTYVKRSASAYNEYTHSVNYADGNWHLVIITFDGNIHTLDIDGKNVYTSSALAGSTQSSSTIVYIGKTAHGSAYQYMNGSIDDVGFWPRILSKFARTNIYAGGDGLPSSSFAFSGAGLITNLSAHLKFDELSGQFLDTHGSYHSTTVNANYPVAGKNGSAANFVQADSDYAEFPQWSGIGTVDRSISFWFKTPSSQSEYNRIAIFAKDNTSADEPAFAISLRSSDGKLSVGLRGSYALSASALSPNTWYHVVQIVEYSTRTYWAYLNGQYVGTGIGSAGFIAANAQLNIARYNSHYGQHGSITVDEMSIWINRKISLLDILNLYADGSGTFYDEYKP